MDRLAHLNEILTRLEAQVAGHEIAKVMADPAKQVQLNQQIAYLRREMEPFRAEKAQLEAGGGAVDPVRASGSSRCFSSYNPATFTGREAQVAQLRGALDQGKRLLWIQGMTGIGKTTLGERLAAEALGDRVYVAVDCQRDFGGGDFVQGAIALLGRLGDESAQQLPTEQVLPYVLKRLGEGRYWVQWDSVEALLAGDCCGDGLWVQFWEQFGRSAGTGPMVLTTQALPQDFDREGRLGGAMAMVPLEGLTEEQGLALLVQGGIVPKTEEERGYLGQIIADFEGHPFILEITAGEIKLRPFNGDVGRYWREYYQKERQQRPKLRQSQREKVEARVERVIEQLPEEARRLLLAGAVFNRAVSEEFYLALGSGEALELLVARGLVQERDLSGSSWLLGQHNLVREGALVRLRQDSAAWEAAQRRAADLWLTRYEPGKNISVLEIISGHLEALSHFYAVNDLEQVKKIVWEEFRSSKPFIEQLGV